MANVSGGVSVARRFVLMFGAAGFLTAQISLMDKQWVLDTADGWLAIAGMVIWALALILLLGPWLLGGTLNDELVQANRRKALAFGYVAMLMTSLAFFGLSIAGEVSGTEAAHLIFAVGIAAPMFGFAVLERAGS